VVDNARRDLCVVEDLLGDNLGHPRVLEPHPVQLDDQGMAWVDHQLVSRRLVDSEGLELLHLHHAAGHGAVVVANDRGGVNQAVGLLNVCDVAHEGDLEPGDEPDLKTVFS